MMTACLHFGQVRVSGYIGDVYFFFFFQNQ